MTIYGMQCNSFHKITCSNLEVQSDPYLASSPRGKGGMKQKLRSVCWCLLPAKLGKII